MIKKQVEVKGTTLIQAGKQEGVLTFRVGYMLGKHDAEEDFPDSIIILDEVGELICIPVGDWPSIVKAVEEVKEEN